jgi:hypothetical protein
MGGNWWEDSFTGDPKDISKALEMGVCLNRSPDLGEHGGTLLY